jgi:hypothetical protein
MLLSCTRNFVSSAALGKIRHENESSRSVLIRNKSGGRLDAMWINRFNRDGIVTYSTNSDNGEGYAYGASANILSYIGHEFRILEMPGNKTRKCKFEKCQEGHFQVNDQEEQGMLWEKTINEKDVHTLSV